MRYFDAHCHVQFDIYDPDRDALLARMKEEGVGGIVVGVELDSSARAVALVEKHEQLWAAVGLHPNRERDEWFEVDRYRELARSPKVVAIGECGLDYYRPTVVDEDVKNGQKKILEDQIALAVELDKPLIIHSRPSKGMMDAYEDLLELLESTKRRHPNLRGDVHFFVGTPEIARRLFSIGFTVSFTAVITFARDYDEVIRTAPAEYILTETDAPYVPPTNRPRGSRNDPLAVADVVAKIAEIRSEDEGTMRPTLVANAKRLFSLPGV